MNWQRKAACLGAPPGIFHPSVPPRGDPRQALAYCRRCPVIAECAAEALRTRRGSGIVAGIWLCGDRAWPKLLREIVFGHTARKRCVKCWRIIESASSPGTCSLCGFAEIPV
ncbi:WhiB family transcriptional regulator [Nocardia sp. NPDC052566]|uniref:WhiB family transcriptional regulator n=1 Tax=Nocardia sp. NPDC052566 TaxID=3364330 RepID=UPI0037C75C55